jgi:hypothetical protein
MLRAACFAVLMLAATSARSQTPDTTTVVPADTVVAPTDIDIVVAAPPEPEAPPFPIDSVIAFHRDHRGIVIHRRFPERLPALHPTELLERLPGGFVHSFRTPGWPEGWSIGGRDPATVTISRDGRPFNNLTTGRSQMELLPLGLSDPIRLAEGSDGGAATVVSNMLALDEARPITGLRYQSDGIGLQHAELYHAQRRLVSIFGTQGLLNLSLAYIGRGATGEYPGSALRRERGLFARARFGRPGWSLAVSNLSSRHNVGAHAGVVPQANIYETIFVRTGAIVNRQEARRQTIRNELDVTWRAHLLEAPFTLTGYWTAESFRYYESRYDVAARVHRYGLTLDQPLSADGMPIRFHGWIERVENDTAFVNELNRHAVEASIGDSLALGFGAVDARLAIRSTAQSTAPGGHVRLTVGASETHAYLSAESNPIDAPRILLQGFGPFLAPTEVGAARASVARLGATASFGPFRANAFLFAQHDQSIPILSTDAGRDTLEVHAGYSSGRFGAGGFLGWREHRERGVYAFIAPSFVQWQSQPAIAGLAPLETAVPAMHGEARLGARMLLFLGDLDADLYVRGRFWSDMRGRVLHPATGLLVYPSADARTFSASGLLDVVLEADIRTASVFVALENVLSGTDVTIGNLIVPDYPLPERRLRFGVYWPILD